jgi:hypothetical protein
MINIKTLAFGAGAGLGLLLLLALMLKKNLLVDLGAGVAKGATDLVGGVVTGVIEGVTGLPQTDESECMQAIREGRTWDASFKCDAATFLKYAFGPGDAARQTGTAQTLEYGFD